MLEPYDQDGNLSKLWKSKFLEIKELQSLMEFQQWFHHAIDKEIEEMMLLASYSRGKISYL